MTGFKRALVGTRAKLTLSYVGVFVGTTTVLMTVVALFILRYIPDAELAITRGRNRGGLAPGRGPILDEFVPRAAVVIVVLLLTVIAVSWILAGRILRPLPGLTRAAQLTSQGSLTHRVHYNGPRDEFGRLADTFDAMLSDLQRHDEQQRRFAANASHELRTPLAATRAVLDIAAGSPETVDVAKLVQRLHRINEHAIATTDAMLLMARAQAGDESTTLHEKVDLSLLAEEAVENLVPVAEQRSVMIRAGRTNPAHGQGSTTLLLQMVHNLVHNAIVHNLDSGGWVEVSTGTDDGGRAWMEVANTGAVVPDEALPTLTDAFSRVEGRVRREDGAGAGLGLSVVDAIVRAHRATWAPTTREGGGLRVRVTLEPTSSAI